MKITGNRWFIIGALPILATWILYASSLIVPMGCVSSDAPPAEQTNSVLKISAIVEMSAQLATFAAVRDNPDNAKFFRAAQLVINAAVTRGEYNPTNVAALLRSVSVNGADSDVVFLAVTSALNVYKIAWGDAIEARLDQHIYVRPVLQALSRGIQLGLDGPRTERKFNLPRK